MPLRLIIEDDEGATTIVPLGKEAITIGRQQGNTIQLTEKNVSRNHARLFPEAEAWMIEDLNSYNGIKVNDKPVDGRTKLREGDIVQIGDYHLAITEDVDKRTLNYDRPGVAANDGDPLLASSSADLPRLSPEEIHALSSGPQQITPPPSPMMVDSGPVPATAYAQAYAEPRKKGLGLWLFLGILALGAGGVAAVLVLQPDGNDAGTTTAKTEKANAAAPDTKKASQPTPPTTPTPAGDGGVAPPPAADDGAEPPPVDDDDAIEVVDPDPDPEPATPPNTNPDPVPTPPVDPPPQNNTVTKKKKKTTKANTPPPPPDPPDTGPSAEELLSQARAAQMGSRNGEAFRLAKQSYSKKKDSDAAQVMAIAGCKMGDKTKAKYGYSRMKANKDAVKGLCAANGVEL